MKREKLTQQEELLRKAQNREKAQDELNRLKVDRAKEDEDRIRKSRSRKSRSHLNSVSLVTRLK